KASSLKSGELAATLRNAEKLAREIEAATASGYRETISDLVARVDVSSVCFKVSLGGSTLSISSELVSLQTRWLMRTFSLQCRSTLRRAADRQNSLYTGHRRVNLIEPK